MMIHEITQLVEPYKARKRLGRGRGSGHGKTSGRGHKGAKSRSGWSTKLAREGGQLAYFRRIPKRGFSNDVFRENFHIINVSDLQAHFNDGDRVDAAMLAAKGLIRDTTCPVKVLGNGEISRKLTVQAGKASGAAREKIERAGGSLQLSMKKRWSRPAADKSSRQK